jgi:phage protein U
MSTMMLQLGSFQFSTSTACFADLQRAASWEWAEQGKYQQSPDLHFTGSGAETIAISCTQLMRYNSPLKSGETQAGLLRAEAAKGKPMQLVAADGRNLGQWAVVSVAETQSQFIRDGSPQKSTFDLQLKYTGQP